MGQLATRFAPGRSRSPSWPIWLGLRSCSAGESVQIQEFIERWRNTQASERANKDSYLKELCRVLGVPEPDGKTGDAQRDRYVFEADAVVYDEEGKRHVGKMDLYRRGHF